MIMSDLDFFCREINEWKLSPKRLMQIKGFLYYDSEHDILRRTRTAIGENGEITTLSNLPNNRIVNNLYGKMVNQKTDYLLGKPFVVSSENKKYEEVLKGIFDAHFRRTLKALGKAVLCGGIAWLYPFYDQKGEFSVRVFPAYEILPFWKDSSHTVLDCAARLYSVEVYEGNAKTIAQRVELFTKNGVFHFRLENGKLIADGDFPECAPYITALSSGKDFSLNWSDCSSQTHIPLVAVKFGEAESPLLKRVKSLQDAINAMLSDFANNMQEDARNTILVLRNFDGENLGDFRRNLAAYGVIKVRSDGQSGGGVDTLSVQVNSENYKIILELLKKSLIENAMGFDSSQVKSGINLNQMNIRSMYSDMDLDANDMETELQASFAELICFVNIHLRNTSGIDFSNDTADIVFNRDTLINESEAISDCLASRGILSEKTIIEQHPWVNDVSKELNRIRLEKGL